MNVNKNYTKLATNIADRVDLCGTSRIKFSRIEFEEKLRQFSQFLN